jgi:hypothetical protein
MDTSEWEHHLAMLFEEAGREPDASAGVQPWMLWQWRRMSLPQWRRILHESRETHDEGREEYARWMLREVLLDPEYREEKQK